MPSANVSTHCIIRQLSDLADYNIEGRNRTNLMVFINHHNRQKLRNVRFLVVECKWQRRCFVVGDLLPVGRERHFNTIWKDCNLLDTVEDLNILQLPYPDVQPPLLPAILGAGALEETWLRSVLGDPWSIGVESTAWRTRRYCSSWSLSTSDVVFLWSIVVSVLDQRA